METKLPSKIYILDLETEETNFKAPEKSKLAFVGVKPYTLHHGRYYPCKYRCFFPNQATELEEFLKSFPGAIIGHNIFQFDYRVLRPLISLDGVVKKTVDTLAFLHGKNGGRFGGLSLSDLSEVNLERNKSLDGKSISELWRQGKRKKVIQYNENDCILTQALWWHLVDKRSVRIVGKTFNISTRDISCLTGKRPLFTFHTWEQKIERDGYILEKAEKGFYIDDDWGDMSGHIPFEKCPKCGSEDLEKFDELSEGMGSEGMTEGQFAEYMAGTWGTVHCLKCGHWMDYEI